MDLIQPTDKTGIADELRRASAEGINVMPVGGRQHMGRGGPSRADVELSTTRLNQVIDYESAEMIAVVQAGMLVGDLQALLAENGQEWPVDAPDAATVGGTIAAGVSSPRQLRVGLIRDTVVELELVTGDGRLIRSGARTVKNVTGYDVHKLATGSLGTLGVIVQAALKVRPLPRAARTLRADGDGLALGLRLLEAVPMAAGVASTRDAVEIRLEGWPEEVDELEELANTAAPGMQRIYGESFPSTQPWADVGTSTIVEAYVAPSQIGALVEGLDAWTALIGVGLVWFQTDGSAAKIRERASALGGHASVIAGLGSSEPLETDLPAPEVHRRLKHSFDPAGILSPGRLGL
jgi:glycolate oxidase FAD binding subunit